MSTIHTNLVGARVLLKPKTQGPAHEWGTVAAVYLDNMTTPMLLVVLEPEDLGTLRAAPSPEEEGGLLIEVPASRVLRVVYPARRHGPRPLMSARDYRGGNDRGL